MGALTILTHAGLSARLTVDGGLRVAPVANLTDDLRQYIRSHKADLLAELAANDGNAGQSVSASSNAQALHAPMMTNADICSRARVSRAGTRGWATPEIESAPNLTKPDIAQGVRKLANANDLRLSVVAVHPCGTCHWRRAPGATRVGYCAGRDDLPRVYGLLHELPADLGDDCTGYRLKKNVPTNY